MKILLILLLLPALAPAQIKDTSRQLVALTINFPPDETDVPGRYYLVANKPGCVKLKDNQTFLLQSAWHQAGDSIVTIGVGTLQATNDSSAELNAKIYPGKKVQQGDMALFLVPLDKPLLDTLFFKMARLDIVFTTVDDSLFYDRNSMLRSPETYPTKKLLMAMAEDIRHTGEAMIKMQNDQNQKILTGKYKDRLLFTMMQNATAEDVLSFIKYVYGKPDKYKAHQWKVSETFATWAINGAP